ncbi:MAG: TPM domain-containing protein [Bacteroidia bacterium]|nr:TPM domain-containing protein [Bacteroidia bacterium]
MGGFRHFFSEEDKKNIAVAISEVEKYTSGEVRVHLEDHCKGDVLKRAEFHFGKLQMHNTKERTGILFYLAVKDRLFAIYGDQGIHARVPENYWDGIRDRMLDYFRRSEFAAGVIEGIRMAGEQLKEHFPAASRNDNELSNEVSSS